jgi:hypothetical protein
MKQIFAFIFSLSLAIVATASANSKDAATLSCHASVIAKNTVCKNNDHKVFASSNTNAQHQPVGKTKVSKSPLSGFSKNNTLIPAFVYTRTTDAAFFTYKNVQPVQRLYVLHCSYLL